MGDQRVHRGVKNHVRIQPLSRALMRGQITFPSTPVGSKTTTTITLKNPWPTSATLLIQLEGEDFAVQPGPEIILEPGDTKEIIIAFRPQTYPEHMDNPRAIGTLTLVDTRTSLPPIKIDLEGAMGRPIRSTE